MILAAFDQATVWLGSYLGVEGVRPRRGRPPGSRSLRRRRPGRDGRRGRLDRVGPPEQPVGLVIVELLLVQRAPLVVSADKAALLALAAFGLPAPRGGLEREGGLVGGGDGGGGQGGGGREADELPVDPLRAGVPRADAAGEHIVLGPRFAAAAACRLVLDGGDPLLEVLHPEVVGVAVPGATAAARQPECGAGEHIKVSVFLSTVLMGFWYCVRFFCMNLGDLLCCHHYHTTSHDNLVGHLEIGIAYFGVLDPQNHAYF